MATDLANVEDIGLLKVWAELDVSSARVKGLALDSLEDVDAEEPVHGESLVWNALTEKWEAAGLTTANLEDFLISTPASGQTFSFDGTYWVNVTPTLSWLADVTTATPATGQVLRWTGTEWQNGTVAYSEVATRPWTASGTGWKSFSNTVPWAIGIGVNEGHLLRLSGTEMAASITLHLYDTRAAQEVLFSRRTIAGANTGSNVSVEDWVLGDSSGTGVTAFDVKTDFTVVTPSAADARQRWRIRKAGSLVAALTLTGASGAYTESQYPWGVYGPPTAGDALTVYSTGGIRMLGALAAGTFVDIPATARSGYTTTSGLSFGLRNTSSIFIGAAQTAAANSGTGVGVVAIGYQAGAALTTSSDAVYIGRDAGMSRTTGAGSVYIGKDAARLATAQDSAVVIGYQAASETINIGSSVIIGYQARQFAVAPQQADGPNVIIGYRAGRYMGIDEANASTNNVIIGGQTASGALTVAPAASRIRYCTIVGYGAFQSLSQATDHTVAIGMWAYQKGVVTANNNNVAIGNYSCQNADGNANAVHIGYGSGSWGSNDDQTVAVGSQTLGGSVNSVNAYSRQNTVAVGFRALRDIGDGQHANVVIGSEACRDMATGENNVVIGRRALVIATSSSRNTCIGFEAGDLVSTGTNNILIGYRAGDLLTTGSNNLILGYDLDVPSATGTHQLNIGGVITGTVSAGGTPGVTFPHSVTFSAGQTGLTLDSLDGVVITAGASGEVLRHNGTNWVDAVLALADLSNDIAISGPTNGQVLTFNSGTGKWVNSSAASASALNDLTDVTISSPANGEFLKYDSGSGQWINSTAGSANSLNDLTDVVISSPATGQVVRFGGSNWVNAQQGFSDLSGTIAITQIADAVITRAKIENMATASLIGRTTGGSGVMEVLSVSSVKTLLAYSLDDMTDVVLGTPAAGEVLRFSGSEWVDAALAADDLSDVTISAPATGQVFRWNGSAWVNAQLAYSDLSGTPGAGSTTLAGLSDVSVASMAAWDVLRWNGTLWVNSQMALDNLSDVVINTPASGMALRFNGSEWRAAVLGFADLGSSIAVGQIPANIIADTMLRDSAALSVIGRSANTVGDPADIVAVTDGHVLRLAGTTLGFGTIVEAGIAAGAVTLAKLADIDTARFLGRVTAATGPVESLTVAQVKTALAYSLDDLSDVAVSSPLAAQVIRHNGLSWVNGTVSYADLTGAPNFWTKAEADARFAEIALEQEVDDLWQALLGERLAYQTLAELQADLDHEPNTLAEVVADPDETNNGTYYKEGAFGAGSWIKSENDTEARLTALEQGLPEAIQAEIETAGLIDNVRTIDTHGRTIVLAGTTTDPALMLPMISIDEATAELYGKFGITVMKNIRTPGDGTGTYFVAADGVDYRAVPMVIPGDEEPPTEEPVYVLANMRLPGDVDVLFGDPTGRYINLATEQTENSGIIVTEDAFASLLPNRLDNFTLGDDTEVPPEIPEQITLDGDAILFWINHPGCIVFPSGNLLQGFVDSDGSTCVVHYNVTTGVATKTVLYTLTDDIDDHNTPSLCVMPDGKVMAAWAQHAADTMLRTSISLVDEPVDIDDWGAVTTTTLASQQSYSNLHVCNGSVYNLNRNWGGVEDYRWNVGRWDGSQWVDNKRILNAAGGNGNGYPRMAAEGDKLWFVHATTEQDADNGLVVFYLDTTEGTWHAPDGTFLANYLTGALTTADLRQEDLPDSCWLYRFTTEPISLTGSYDSHVPDARVWTYDMRVKDGVPYIGFSVMDFNGVWGVGRQSHQRHHYHWAAFLQGRWVNRFVANGGWGLNNHSATYQGGIALHPLRPEDIVISTNETKPFRTDRRRTSLSTLGHHELFYGEHTPAGYAWRALTEDSDFPLLHSEGSVGHTRPYIYTNGTEVWLTFMSGYYRKFSNYPASWSPTNNWVLEARAIQLE